VLPFAVYSATPNDTELVAVLLSVIVGAVFLTVSLAALLLWVARGRRVNDLPRITPIDDRIGEMWARQLKMPRPLANQQRRQAA
jgi:hypothetical protein